MPGDLICWVENSEASKTLNHYNTADNDKKNEQKKFYKLNFSKETREVKKNYDI